MQTVRYAISRVRSTHRLLSADDSINDRTIAAELKSAAISLITQKTNARRYWNTDTIFTTIPCLEMINVPLAECCDYTSFEQISRSKYQLPRIIDGNYQYLIQGVYNVESGKKFDYMPPIRYINQKKLQLNTNKVYYWIHNDYLYLTEEDVQEVRISAYFESDVPDNIMYNDCKCTSRKKKDPCKNPLDEDFKCPAALMGGVISMVSKFLLETYFRVPEDKTADNKDDTTSNKN